MGAHQTFYYINKENTATFKCFLIPAYKCKEVRVLIDEEVHVFQRSNFGKTFLPWSVCFVDTSILEGGIKVGNVDLPFAHPTRDVWDPLLIAFGPNQESTRDILAYLEVTKE